MNKGFEQFFASDEVKDLISCIENILGIEIGQSQLYQLYQTFDQERIKASDFDGILVGSENNE